MAQSVRVLAALITQKAPVPSREPRHCSDSSALCLTPSHCDFKRLRFTLSCKSLDSLMVAINVGGLNIFPGSGNCP